MQVLLNLKSARWTIHHLCMSELQYNQDTESCTTLPRGHCLRHTVTRHCQESDVFCDIADTGQLELGNLWTLLYLFPVLADFYLHPLQVITYVSIIAFSKIWVHPSDFRNRGCPLRHTHLQLIINVKFIRPSGLRADFSQTWPDVAKLKSARMISNVKAIYHISDL